MKKCLLTLFACLPLGYAELAFSCDYHDKPAFGMFAKHNPIAMQHHFASAPTKKPEITHEKTVQTTAAIPHELKVKYYMPFAFKNASVRFVMSPELESQSPETIEVKALRGSISFEFLAKQAGEYSIEIHTEATNNGQPFSLVQHVNVIATDELTSLY